MPPSASGIKDFALAIWSDWLTLLSGPLSVPAAAAAYWVSNEIAKVLLGVTAFCCLLFSAYRLWKREHDKVVERDQRKRQLLDDISALRNTMVQYRIEMERDHRAQQFNQAAWEAKYDDLQNQIATKIEHLSSKADANVYRNRGNIPRAHRLGRPAEFIWPVLIDVCAYDLDYLKTLIHDYSRGRERTI
jgi:hypothetical protein